MFVYFQKGFHCLIVSLSIISKSLRKCGKEGKLDLNFSTQRRKTGPVISVLKEGKLDLNFSTQRRKNGPVISALKEGKLYL